jgi:hypothetical protein
MPHQPVAGAVNGGLLVGCRARPCHEIALASTYDPERTPMGIAVQAPPKIWQRRPLDQRTNQTQEFLLLWAAASSDEKRSDLNVGDLAT